MLPGQQGWFGPPQAPHLPETQISPAAQVLPKQQGCPAAPQATQVVFPSPRLQTLLPWQKKTAEPETQQGWPVAPQDRQTKGGFSQMSPAAQGKGPSQQG